MGRRLEAPFEEGGRGFGESDDLVRRLAIELEVELRLGTPVLPIREGFQLGATEGGLASFVRLTVMLTRGVWRSRSLRSGIALAEVTMPRAMRPEPPSDSLARTKITSPSAMCLPPYIVFCREKKHDFAFRSAMSVLIAYMDNYCSVVRLRSLVDAN